MTSMRFVELGCLCSVIMTSGSKNSMQAKVPIDANTKRQQHLPGLSISDVHHLCCTVYVPIGLYIKHSVDHTAAAGELINFCELYTY